MMSQRCPHCLLHNPPEALRCDCGYDFTTKTVRASYVLEHAVRKHGGEAALLAQTSRRNIRTGAFLIGFCVIFAIVALFADGRVRTLGWLPVLGVILLIRGLRQRRQRTLDDSLKRELIRRS